MRFVYARELTLPNKYINVQRAAVVPFTIKEGDLYFCFGKDTKTSDITDAGGGRKRNETLIQTGFREWEEEFRAIFGKEHRSFNDSCMLVSALSEKRRKCAIFYPVLPCEIREAPKRFKESVIKDEFSNKAYKELSDIIWVNTPKLRRLTSRQGEMWKELKPFYHEALKPDMFELLRRSYNYKFSYRRES
jgi:hypothetical protein